VLQVLHQDIVSHRSVLVYMTDNVASSSIPQGESRVSDVTRQYSTLCSAVSDRLERLERSVSDHEHYKEVTKSICADLDKLKISIAGLPELLDVVPALTKSLAVAEVRQSDIDNYDDSGLNVLRLNTYLNTFIYLII